MRRAYIDTETTGFSRSKGATLVEVGMVVIDDSDWSEVYDYNAIVKVPPEALELRDAKQALEINGIKPEEIAAGENVEDAATELQARLANVDQVHAFNVAFDSKFLEVEPWSIEKGDWGDCIMLAAQKAMKQRKWPKLGEAARFFNIPQQEPAHRALADARTAMLVHKAILMAKPALMEALNKREESSRPILTDGALRLETKGIKLRDHDITFGKRTVVTGPCESGKSTITNGLEFLFLGYSPSQGKREADTAALSTGQRGEIMAKATLPDGKVFRRRLFRKGKSYTGEVDCSWLRNASASEHHQAIVELVGREELDAAEGLDIRELLKATPNKRSARVEQLVSSDKQSPKELSEKVVELTARRLTGKVETKVVDWKYLLGSMTQGQHDVLMAERAMLEGKVVEGGIPTAILWANDEKKKAAKGAKQKAQAQKELEGRLEKLPPVEEGEVEKLEDEKARLNREAGAARQRASESKGLRDKLTAAEREAEDASIAVDKLLETTTQSKAIKERIAKAEKLIAEKEKALGELTGPAAPDYSESEKTAAEVQKYRRQAHAIVVQPPDFLKTNELIRDRDKAKAKLESLTGSAWGEVKAISKAIETYYPSDKKAKGWASRLSKLAVDSMGGDPKVLAEELKTLEANLKRAVEADGKQMDEAKEASGNVEKLRERANSYEKMARDQKDKVDDAHAALKRLYLDKKEALTNDKVALAKEIRDLSEQLTDADRNLTATQERKRIAQTSLEALRAMPTPKDDRVALQDDLDALTTKLESLRHSAAAGAEMADLVKQIEESKAAQEVMAAIEWSLQRIREEEITEAGGPLVSRMATFLTAAGRPEVPYFKAAEGKCEIGWKTPKGHKVQIQTLSGGAWVLFATALTAAVISIRNAPLRILIVEAGETDKRIVTALMKGISAVSDDLTHTVLMTQWPPEVEEGWDVVTLEGEEAA